jgi:hypothetical protein
MYQDLISIERPGVPSLLGVIAAEVMISEVLKESDKRAILLRCVATIHATVVKAGSVSSEEAAAVVEEFSEDRVLVANLVRNVLPTPKQSGATGTGTMDANGVVCGDDLTDYVTLLFTTIATAHPLAFGSVYKAVASSADVITPEQVVLLHSLQATVDAVLGDSTSNRDFITLDFVSHQASIYEALAGAGAQVPVVGGILPVSAAILGLSLSIKPALSLPLHTDHPALMATTFALLPTAPSALKISALRLLSNMLYRNEPAQLSLTTQDVYALLNCTNTSTIEDLTMREWAVVAVRNAVEGCERNKTIIENLEKQTDNKLTQIT